MTARDPVGGTGTDYNGKHKRRFCSQGYQFSWTPGQLKPLGTKGRRESCAKLWKFSGFNKWTLHFLLLLQPLLSSYSYDTSFCKWLISSSAAPYMTFLAEHEQGFVTPVMKSQKPKAKQKFEPHYKFSDLGQAFYRFGFHFLTYKMCGLLLV